MKKILSFFTTNKEPVGLKALKLQHCTKPKTVEKKEAPKKPKQKGPTKLKAWDLPSRVKDSDFYKSLKEIEKNKD